MHSRRIIAEAWEFTKSHKRLMWWYAFFPALLTTIVNVLYVTYQFFAFKRSELFDNAGKSFIVEFFQLFVGFMNKHSALWVPTVLLLLGVGLLYFLLPTICQGGIIRYIAKKRTDEQVRLSSALSYGLLVFLPLLEYHLLIKTFSLFSIITEAGFVLRNLGVDAMKTFLPIFIIFFFFGLLVSLFVTYSEYFIVLEKKSVLDSISASAKLVLLSWKDTFLIGILMLIIGARVIFNIIVTLIIPVSLFVFGGYVASVTFNAVGLYLGIILGIIALFFSAYFTGILNVFANAVWTYTFMELRADKDVNEEIAQ